MRDVIRLVAVLLCTGIVALLPLAARTQTVEKLRVAAIPIDVGALSLYAQDQGFFKKHGLDVDITLGGTGAAVAAAVVGGSLDIGDGNTTTLAAAHERGVPFVLLAPSGAYTDRTPTSALVVLKNSPIASAKDLTGKVIGVGGLRTIGEVAARAWLESNGVSGDAVQYVEVPFAAMDATLASGRVAAVMAEEPDLSEMIAGDGRVLAKAYSAIAPQWILGGYFCTLDFAQSHPDVVRRFADAMSEAAAWANANHAATAAILAKYGKGPIPPNVQRMYYPERLRAADLQPLIDASAKFGILKSTFPARDMFAPGIGS
jgi:NitT/TauT family transport system substrate-binding protein